MKISTTHLNFNDDNSKLQFAIVSDLWGGYRSGIFEDAVSKLDLLQPQFVMSVGDLIDGNTYNLEDAYKQWLNFNNKIKNLTMPFFYVPGNHDLGNPFLENVWKDRLGNPYYHFVKNNVLFLCVNTEDGGKGGIKANQIEYFKNAINDNQNVRWTFIFMHRPVWFTENAKQEGYEQIESFLKGRKYTLFSGHHHTYVKAVKNGNNHYVLGSTGGGSDLRGEIYGEFDHITLVSMINNEEPKIVNLKLNGIIKDDIVNEKTYPINNTLINATWLNTPAYVANKKMVNTLDINIQLKNPTPYPLYVTGKLHDGLYQFNPELVNIEIPAGQTKNYPITLKQKNNQPINLSKTTSIGITLNGSFVYDSFKYEIPASKKILISYMYPIALNPTAKHIALNQYNLNDTTGMIILKEPEYLKNKWYWSGSKDASVQFKLSHDANNIYLLAYIKDDELIMDNTGDRDRIFINFENKNGQIESFTILPSNKQSIINAENSNTILAKELDLTLKVEKDNLVKMMLVFPKDKILKKDQSIRFNIGYHDVDITPEKRFSDLFWKPVWLSETDYKKSGTFILN